MAPPLLCSSCSAEISIEHRFCSQCGAPTPAHQDATARVAQDERRHLTVMFCDLVESTTLSESVDPEELLDLVRRYQSVVRNVVEKYEGHIAQYLGDGVLVYFGYPRAHEDDARRAVLSGLEILVALEAALNRDLPTGLEGSIACRIGVHTGPVVAGAVGAGARTENLALGHTPNVAARVQGAAEPGQVLLSGDTHRLVEQDFECEALGARELKGLSEPVRLHRALRALPPEHRTRVRSSARQSPFVGRQRELGLLLERFHEARNGEGQSILLSGGPGFGKSRLQHELRGRTETQVELWIECRCSPYRRNTALHPITEFAEHTLGFSPEDTTDDRLAKLESRLEQATTGGGEDVALLARLLSLPTDRYERGPSNPERDRRNTLHLLAKLLVGCSERGLVVFALEDLHWADPSTLEFLELLVDQIHDSSILQMASSRLEQDVRWADRPNFVRIELDRLNDNDSSNLIRAMSPLEPTLQQEIVERADGVPLFVEELTRTLVAEGLHHADRPPSGRVLDTLIPNTLRDSLTAQLDRLGASKDVAQLASVLGRSFRYDLLEAVSAVKGAALRERFDPLVDSGLLLPDPAEPQARYEFKHALVQETAYDSLRRTHRRELHDRVADVLVASTEAGVAHPPESLARHCEAAGRKAAAAKYYETIGIHAADRSANLEAIGAFRHALTLVSDLEESVERHQRELQLLPRLSAVLSAREGHGSPELPAIYERMRELMVAVGLGNDLVSLVTFWGFHAARGDRDETLHWATEIKAVAAENPGPLQDALASFVDGWTAFYVGDQPHATETLETGLKLLGDPWPESLDGLGSMIFLARLNRSWSLVLAGYPERSWSTVCEALAHAESMEDPFAVAQALGYQAGVAQDLRRPAKEIGAIAERLVEVANEFELGSYIPFGHTFYGWARAMQGEHDGLDEMADAIAASLARGDRNSNGHSYALLAGASMELGDFARARDAVEACLAACGENLEANFEAEGHRLRAELLRQDGDLEAARASAARAVRVAQQHGARLLELRAAATAFRLADDDASRRVATANLESVYRWFAEGFDHPDLLEVRALLGRAKPLGESEDP